MIHANDFKAQNQIRTAKKVKTTGANQLTKSIIQFLSLNGFIVFRSNVMGVFDSTKAAKEILKLIKSVLVTRKLPTLKTIQNLLRKCYRKSHERKGQSDIIGYQKKGGRFIAVEVKFGKDTLKIEQQQFLKEVAKSGGIAILAKSFDLFVYEFYQKK